METLLNLSLITAAYKNSRYPVRLKTWEQECKRAICTRGGGGGGGVSLCSGQAIDLEGPVHRGGGDEPGVVPKPDGKQKRLKYDTSLDINLNIKLDTKIIFSPVLGIRKKIDQIRARYIAPSDPDPTSTSRQTRKKTFIFSQQL